MNARRLLEGSDRWGALLIVVTVVTSCGGGTTSPPPPPASVASVTVSPANDTVLVAASVQLHVTLRDSVGDILTGRPVKWESAIPLLATVDTAGVVRALALGTVTVKASSGGKSDSAYLYLAPKITISRDLPSLFAGDTTALRATLTDALGTPLVGGPVLWGTGDPSVATVNPAGIVTGVAPGFVTITALFNGGVGKQVVAVLQPRIAANRELSFLREHQRPDGARIQSLWLMQANGSAQTLISTDSEFVNDFDWSWDGSKVLLAYVTFNGIGRGGTFVLNADGSGEHKASSSIGSPRWSPDGTRIAYHSTPGPSDIYTVNPDGTGAQRLTFDGLSADPVWSPDGRQIAFQHVGAIGIMHADGSALHVDTMPVAASTLFWSPDGKQIAFAAFTPDSREWLVNADGSNPAPICYSFGCAGSEFDWPPWSLDESHLVLQDAGGVQIVRAQDSTAILIAGAITPRWSPDGSFIAFVSPADTAPAFPWIRTVHADGTSPLVLTGNDTTNTRLPVWRP